ncbi:hypothetical protein BDBG_05848 [Blastomyces gilchristii SLH14081]|uniref:Uncharacterized protein n=1 Tax=Blastomyces gilchristii (strain SLH14081) TaxID=559298 RepID=A0A179UQ18_BLAGS|nr:uncharacterized protein BDBG_05848 [Blastomyces gilchristii SLH14081]OAT10175.1 hypothetical protein BDBG_05848 [Blastomyces gilchristii SLH14081]
MEQSSGKWHNWAQLEATLKSPRASMQDISFFKPLNCTTTLEKVAQRIGHQLHGYRNSDTSQNFQLGPGRYMDEEIEFCPRWQRLSVCEKGSLIMLVDLPSERGA